MAEAGTDNARCARCGGAFHCGANDTGTCACESIALDAATLGALRTRYTGCLCVGCLAAIAGGADLALSAADRPRTSPGCD